MGENQRLAYLWVDSRSFFKIIGFLHIVQAAVDLSRAGPGSGLFVNNATDEVQETKKICRQSCRPYPIVTGTQNYEGRKHHSKQIDHYRGNSSEREGKNFPKRKCDN